MSPIILSLVFKLQYKLLLEGNNFRTHIPWDIYLECVVFIKNSPPPSKRIYLFQKTGHVIAFKTNYVKKKLQ